jgi:CubicO group peptidase (beta-lactamase class C family)
LTAVEQRARAACEELVAQADLITLFTPTPGGVVVVADVRGVLAEASFGHADLERRTPMTSDRLFEIGSISKVFAGLLFNQLVDEGRATLDTSVVDVLPWLGLGAHSADITLRHLLNHSAGLVSGVDALTDDLDQAWCLRDLVGIEPGRMFHYSNVGYVVLGLAATALTGRPLPELVSERLLGPMGMSASVAAVRHEDRPRLAVGYQAAEDDRHWLPGAPLAPAPWFEVAAADGNIAAPAGDLARLLMLLLGDGSVDGQHVLSREALDRMIESLSPGGEPIAEAPGCPAVESSRYGLGINVESVAGNRCVSHGGGMVGYSTFVLADLSAGFGAAVLTNADGNGLTAQRLTRWLHARVVGPAADLPFPVSDPRVSGVPGEAPPVPTGAFVSDDPTGGSLVVALDPSGLQVTIELDGVAASLYRAENGHFVSDHPRLGRFHLDPESKDGIASWVHGPLTFRPPEADAAEQAVPESWRTMTGHFRSFSPWYPHLRIYPRSGRLWLAAPGGVEAPGEPEELVPLGDGVFRIGADPEVPERLWTGPVVDGRVVHLIRDGCRYSRAFTD